MTPPILRTGKQHRDGPDPAVPRLIVPPCHVDVVCCVAFSPDGSTLATASYDGQVVLWDVQTARVRRVMSVEVGTETNVFFSPNGRVVGASNYGQTWLCDAHTGASMPNPNVCQALGFADDSCSLVATPADRWSEIALWDISTSQARVITANSGVLACADSSGSVIAVADGREVRLLDAKTGAQLCGFGVPDEVSLSFAGMALSPRGRSVYLPHSRSAAAYETESGNRAAEFAVCSGTCEPGPAAFSRDGRTVAVEQDVGIVAIWDTETWETRTSFRASKDGIRSMCFSPDDGMLAVGGDDHGAALWDTRTWSLIRHFRGHNDAVGRVGFSDDGHTVHSLYCDSTRATWSDQVEAAAPTPPWRRTFRWNIRTPIELPDVCARHTRPAGQIETPIAAVVSPDGRTLAVGYERWLVVMWDMDTAQELLRLDANMFGDSPSSLAFSPDGQTLAVGTDWMEKVGLYSVKTGRRKRVLEDHRGNITGVAFSPDGRLLATCAQDGAVKLSNPRTGRLLLTLMRVGSRRHRGWIAFTPDGTFDCSRGAGRHIRWRVGTEILPFKTYAARFRSPGLVGRILTGAG